MVLASDLHNLRKEFIQRVFTFYIIRNMVEEEQLAGAG